MKFLLALCLVTFISLASSAPSKSWELGQANKERELSQKASSSIKERETDVSETEAKAETGTTAKVTGSDGGPASPKELSEGSATGTTTNIQSEKEEETVAKVENVRAMAPMGMMHPMAMPMHPMAVPMHQMMNMGRAGHTRMPMVEMARAGHGRAGPARAAHARQEDSLNQSPANTMGILGAHPFGHQTQANAAGHNERNAAFTNEHAHAAIRNAQQQFAQLMNAGQTHQTRGLGDQAPIQTQGFGMPMGVQIAQPNTRGIGHPQMMMRALG